MLHLPHISRSELTLCSTPSGHPGAVHKGKGAVFRLHKPTGQSRFPCWWIFIASRGLVMFRPPRDSTLNRQEYPARMS